LFFYCFVHGRTLLNVRILKSPVEGTSFQKPGALGWFELETFF
jgi:hypothetical protein